MPTATVTKPTSKEIVRAKYPRATSREFQYGGWEIYETEDTETSMLLGGGYDLPVTWEQDEVDYKITEDAAWDDAARTTIAHEKLVSLVSELVNELLCLATDEAVSTQKRIYSERFAARMIYDAQVPQELRDMAPLIRTQDNAITADPLFVIYEKERVYGMDPEHSDEFNTLWINADGDYEEASRQRHQALEKRYYRNGVSEYGGWRRVCYTDRDKFSRAFFTRKSAENYIRRNSHNLKRPHIFVESMYRNYEMIAVRNFLETL